MSGGGGLFPRLFSLFSLALTLTFPLSAWICRSSGNLSNLRALNLEGPIAGAIPTEMYVLFVASGRTMPGGPFRRFLWNTAHTSFLLHPVRNITPLELRFQFWNP
jgi:hypothetical protein